MIKRVLVVTLIARFGGKVHYFPPAMAAIFRLNWPYRLDHFSVNGGEPKEDPVSIKYTWAQELFLAGGYDAMLTVESDNVPPADALERLAELETDIAYGPYCLKSRRKHWSVATSMTHRGAKFLSDEPELAKRAWGQVVECYGIGFGCTLIKRHVLEAAPIRHSMVRIMDHTLALDAAAYGFTQLADMGCPVGHIMGDDIIYPACDEGRLWRAEPWRTAPILT